MGLGRHTLTVSSSWPTLGGVTQDPAHQALYTQSLKCSLASVSKATSPFYNKKTNILKQESYKLLGVVGWGGEGVQH